MRLLQRPALVGAVTFLFGLIIAAFAASWQGQRNERLASAQFDVLAARVTADVSARMQTYEYGLRGLRGMAAATVGAGASDAISAESFQRYSATRDLRREFPGARGFGLIWRVPQAEEAAYVERVRQGGAPDFAVRQFEPHAGDRYVIRFVSNVHNSAALGLDVASEATRLVAAQRAMRTGLASLTAPIRLVKSIGGSARSFLLLLPFYRPETLLDTGEQREAATLGWSFAPLVIDEILRTIDRDASHYTLALRDTEAMASGEFYNTAANAGTVVAGLERHLVVPIFGRVWAADIRATPAYLQSLHQTPPADVGFAVAGVGALCAILAGVLTRLANRTRSERIEQARRAVIVESSDDAIVGQTLDGIITDWNAGAERLFGYPASQALGRSAAGLLLTTGREIEEFEIRLVIGRGERLAPFESTRRHCDGSWIDVSITAAPVRAAGGRPVAFAATIRDIRQSQQAKRHLAEANASLERQVAERTAQLGTALHDLRAILDAVPSMIGYWDERLINRVANRAYAEWFGRDAESVPGMSLSDLLGPEHFERTRLHAEAALRGQSQRFERAATRPGGSPQHLVVHYVPDVRDGRVRGFYVLIHDVTELIEGRLKLAAVQRDSEALLRTIEQYAIVTVADPSGRITEVNELLCAISGYRAEELVGRDHRILNSGHHEAGFWSEMWRTVASGKAWRGEICNRARNGSRYWVNSIVAPFVAADGTVQKYISIQHDMTAAKLVEERLRSSEAFLDRAGRIAGVGGWELDLATEALTWSGQTCRIHEVPPDYRPNVESAIQFYAPEARAVIESAVACGLRDGKPWDIELPFVTATGRAIWVRSVGTAEFEDGVPVRLIGAFQDVTERRRAEGLLAHERQLMESLLDNLPDQIYFKDRESRFLRVNPALARRLGLASAAAAVGMSDADFFTAEHARETRAVELRILESGEPVLALEEQQFWPDRAPTWNSTTKMLLHDAEGGVIGTFGISRDISARRRMEDDLQRNNQRFSLAAESVGLGVWERDLVAGTLVWDERMQALFGREPAAAGAPEADCSAAWRAGVHRDDFGRCEQELQAAVDGSRSLDTSFRVVLPNGDVRHLKAAAHVLRDADGRAVRMTGVSFDVTEHILAENELRDTMDMLNAVLDSATQASIVASNTDGIITVFNKGAERLFGYSSGEVVGRESPLMLLDRQDLRARASQLSAELGRKVSAGQVLVEPDLLGKPQQWNHRRKDGSIIPMSLAVTAMRGEDGAPRGYLGIGHDISQQQQHERELREAVAKANDANRAKSQFLTRMSHEIRTPMNAVIGLSWVLERTPLDTVQSATLAKIKVASKSLLNIINDVLDLSKIEAAQMSFEQAPFSLATLLRELSELMSVAAEEKGIGFDVEASAAPAALLHGDATRLHQVLSNLVSNAIKFTEHGSVRLRVEPVPTTAAAAGVVRLRFSVVDTGIGITPEALSRLFSPFVQADETTTRRFGGTGLGLSIVKQMVELMGGSVGVRSQPGRGSEFWIELEFKLTAVETVAPTPLPSAASQPGARRLDGVRVLLVDDNAINLEVARCMLEFEGANVWLAQSGQEAVDYLLVIAHAVDVVLMDVQMPVLDGLDATRRIRSGLGLTSLPIIALTAGISSGEHESAHAAGMNDLVSKPFELDTLVGCILRHVGRGVAPSGEFVARPAPGLPDGWPVIAGIDALDVALRLRGDSALFRSMLQRLLGSFGDIAGGRDWAAEASPTLAARFHDLKGSAGTLGAKRIQRLAAAAEVACRAGDAATVERRTRQLGHALRALADTAGGYLQTAAETAARPLAAPASLWDPEPVDVLLRQLGRSDLAAIDGFAALAPKLQQRLDRQAFASLSEDMRKLDFAAVARLLQPLVGGSTKPSEGRSETVPTV